MGAAASFEVITSNNDVIQHQFVCQRCYKLSSRQDLNGISSGGSICSSCESSASSNEQMINPSTSQEVISLSNDTTMNQSSREVISSSMLMNILETHLRVRMDFYYTVGALLDGLSSNEMKTTKVFTPAIENKLRNTKLSTKMITECRGCPLCLEDFVVDGDVMQLPCDHFYHKNCVFPWIQEHITCPVCRFEVPNSMPTSQELMTFDRDDIIEKLKNLDVVKDFTGTSQEDLVELLITAIRTANNTKIQVSDQGDRDNPQINSDQRSRLVNVGSNNDLSEIS